MLKKEYKSKYSIQILTFNDKLKRKMRAVKLFQWIGLFFVGKSRNSTHDNVKNKPLNFHWSLNIYKKLNVTSQFGLLRIALEIGYLDVYDVINDDALVKTIWWVWNRT